MFKLFKKKSAVDQLYDEHEKLLKEAFELSKTDRKASDQKHSEAEAVLKRIEKAELK